jgi:hypothetical protein
MADHRAAASGHINPGLMLNTSALLPESLYLKNHHSHDPKRHERISNGIKHPIAEMFRVPTTGPSTDSLG